MPGLRGLFPQLPMNTRVLSCLLAVAGLFLALATPRVHGQVPGSVDTSFDAGLSPNADSVTAVATQADGGILVALTFYDANANRVGKILRYKANGTLDASFDPVADGEIVALTVLADGKIMVGGAFQNVDGVARPSVVRLDAAGNVDTGFDAQVSGGRVYTVLVQSDGKLVLGGYFNSVGGQERIGLARVSANGALDTGYDALMSTYPQNVLLQADDKVLVPNYLTLFNGQTSNFLARLNTNGTLDTGFVPQFPAETNFLLAAAVRPDGRILASTTLNDNSAALVQLQADGQLDGSFQCTVDGGAISMLPQADGKVLLSGGFTQVNGQSRVGFARVLSSGKLDTVFDPGSGCNYGLSGMVQQADGKAYLFGALNNVGGVARTFLARLQNEPAEESLSQPDLTKVLWTRAATAPDVTDVSFEVSSDGGANWTALGKGTRVGSSSSWQRTGLSLPATGLLRARGRTAGGVVGSSKGIVQKLEDYGPAGSVALSFNPDPDGFVDTMALQPDGKVIVGGSFLNIGGAPHSRLARLNADGSVDETFSPSVDNEVNCLVVQPDGKIVVAGYFGTVNGSPQGGIARLNADGSLDTGFTPPSFDNYFRCLFLQADGRILVGGHFGQVNGADCAGLARLNADGTHDAGFNFDITGVVWAVALQPDGGLVVGGSFSSFGGLPRQKLARLTAAGQVDPNFDPGANSDVNCLAVQADGQILVGGAFTTVGGQLRSKLARLSAAGVVDAAYNPVITAGMPQTLVLQADGKLLVGGNLSANSGQVLKVVRFSADGSVDAAFAPNPNESVICAALQTDGKVLVGGGFGQIGGQNVSRIARLNNDPGSQSLAVLNGGEVRWTRSGATAELTHASLELSTDNGATWNALNGVARRNQSASWTVSGTFPTKGRIRARGRTSGGLFAGSSGLIEQLLTYELAPVVTTGTASDVASLTATLNGTVRSNTDATVFIEYSTDGTFTTSSVTSSTSIPGGADLVSLSVPVTGLLGHRTYYYRITATNETGTSLGSIESFTTSNTLPAAVHDTVTMAPGETKTITLGFATTDDDGDVVTLDSMIAGTQHVSVQGAMNNSLTLTANPVNNFVGDTSFNYTVFDTQMGSTTCSVTVTITGNTDPETSVVFKKGDAVPGAGGMTGIPMDAVFTGFGVPSINDNGQAAFTGKWSSDAGPGSGIFVGDPAVLLVKAGDSAGGGLSYASFSDPVLNEAGRVAFTAKLAGPRVTASNDTALFTNGVTGSLIMVAREGQVMDVADNAKLGSVASFSLEGAEVLFVADLKGGKPLVTSANNRGLYRCDGMGTVSPVLRTGVGAGSLGLGSGTLKAFSALETVAGSSGQARSHKQGHAFVNVILSDGRQALLDIPAGMNPTVLTQRGNLIGDMALPAATFKSFGPFAASQNTSFTAVGASLNADVGGVTSATAGGIFLGNGSSFKAVARSGDVAIAPGAKFSTFKFPLVAADSAALAFGATLKGGAVTTANDTAIFWVDGAGVIQLLGREGAKAAGVTSSARWLAFTSLAIAGGNAKGRPLFMATLQQGVAGVTEANDAGLWAVDRFGALRLIVREGGEVGGKKVRSITALKAVAGAPGVTRSFNNSRELVYRLTFTDNSQAIVYTLVP